MDEAVARITQLLHALVSTDNEQRSQAEQTLQREYIDSQPDIGLPGLVHILRNTADAPVRSFAAVLFRRLALHPIIVSGPDGSKTHTSPLFLIQESTRQGCLAELLAALSSEPVATVRKKLCDCISEVGKALINRNVPWPALAPAVYQCVRAAEPEFRESGFRILGAVPRLLMPNGVVDMTVVGPTFENSLGDSEAMSVRVIALNAAVNFLSEARMEGKGTFNGLMVQMLNVLPSLVAQDNEEGLTEAFTALIELAVTFPRLFRPILPQLLSFSMTILGNQEMEEATRQSCLELLLTLVEEAPSMVRKQTPNFCEQVIPVCLDMMAQIEDDPNWYTTDSIEESDDADEAYIIGEQAMDRIARKLGANVVTPVAFSLIPQLLGSPDWTRRHAGLMAISAIGEGCYKLMAKELEKVVQMVAPYAADAHPRVRYAACNCIGQIATDFAPTVQRKYHGSIIPALMGCMDDVQNPRVQAHGAAALVNFCENVDQSHLKRYLEALFAKLVALSSSAKIYVQEQAITTMATVADAAEDAFVQYYDAVMPALLNILSMPNHKEIRLLRGKAMECGSLIAMAVKKPVFQKDMQAFLSALSRIQSEVNDPDDPQVSYLMHSWARVCTVMNEEFVPYLPMVMPPLLQNAQIKPEVALLDHDENADAYAPEDGWQTAVIEGQRLCIRTSALDDKYAALEMLACYARNLGTGFRPFVPQVMEILVRQLEFYYHDGVRHIACAAIPSVLECAHTDDAILPLWSAAFDKLMKILPNELDTQFVLQAFEAICETILLLRQRGINEQQAAELMRVMDTVLQEYFERVKERESKREDEDYDAEQEDELDEEAAVENSVLTEIAKTLQALLKVFGVAMLPLFDALVETLNKFFHEEEEDLIQVAVSAFDDAIEFTGPSAAKYLQVFGDRMVHALSHNAPGVRQSASYGIGMAAKNGGPPFAPLCSASLQPLVQMIQAPNARTDLHVMATENAIAAIGRILRSPNCPVGDAEKDEYLKFYVQSMPLIWDEDESVIEAAFLCELVEGHHPVIASLAEKTVNSFLELLYQGTLDDDQALQSRALANVKQLLSQMPQEKQSQLWNALEADKRTTLQEKGFF